jgi:MYXO-CTERM domain-containing protein
VDCQVDCQSTIQANCETRLEGGCVAKCESPQGAVKCDGEYVDQGGNAEECLDAIAEWAAQINASASASGSASCSNGRCEAEGEAEAEASCATAPGPKSGGLAALGVFGLILGWAFARRRA